MAPTDTSIRIDAPSNAMLLATTGGLLDAVVYLNHGHVFANRVLGSDSSASASSQVPPSVPGPPRASAIIPSGSPNPSSSPPP